MTQAKYRQEVSSPHPYDWWFNHSNPWIPKKRKVAQLYKKGFSQPLLKCLTKSKASYVPKEVQAGVCGNHLGARSLVGKVLTVGYYYPKMQIWLSNAMTDASDLEPFKESQVNIWHPLQHHGHSLCEGRHFGTIATRSKTIWIPHCRNLTILQNGSRLKLSGNQQLYVLYLDVH